MVEIITIILFFLDTNGNNGFDSKDRILDIGSTEYVYCITSDTKETKPCGYRETKDTDIHKLIEKNFPQEKENVFLLEESFSHDPKNAIGNLYLVKNDGNYILTNDSKTPHTDIYYYTKTPDKERNVVIGMFFNALVFSFLAFLIWLVLFPKKEIK